MFRLVDQIKVDKKRFEWSMKKSRRKMFRMVDEKKVGEKCLEWSIK
jgi:flagellar biosynthesis chaperone FliJ